MEKALRDGLAAAAAGPAPAAKKKQAKLNLGGGGGGGGGASAAASTRPAIASVKPSSSAAFLFCDFCGLCDAIAADPSLTAKSAFVRDALKEVRCGRVLWQPNGNRVVLCCVVLCCVVLCCVVLCCVVLCCVVLCCVVLCCVVLMPLQCVVVVVIVVVTVVIVTTGGLRPCPTLHEAAAAERGPARVQHARQVYRPCRWRPPGRRRSHDTCRHRRVGVCLCVCLPIPCVLLSRTPLRRLCLSSDVSTVCAQAFEVSSAFPAAKDSTLTLEEVDALLADFTKATREIEQTSAWSRVLVRSSPLSCAYVRVCACVCVFVCV